MFNTNADSAQSTDNADNTDNSDNLYNTGILSKKIVNNFKTLITTVSQLQCFSTILPAKIFNIILPVKGECGSACWTFPI